MDLALQPYNYTTYKPDYYNFTTNSGCEYHCYFFDFSTAFSDYPDLAPNVFGFNLELKYKPDKIIGLDNQPDDDELNNILNEPGW